MQLQAGPAAAGPGQQGDFQQGPPMAGSSIRTLPASAKYASSRKLCNSCLGRNRSACHRRFGEVLGARGAHVTSLQGARGAHVEARPKRGLGSNKEVRISGVRCGKCFRNPLIVVSGTHWFRHVACKLTGEVLFVSLFIASR